MPGTLRIEASTSPAKAEPQFLELLEKYPKDSEVNQFHNICLRNQGRYADALERASELYYHDPNGDHVDTYFSALISAHQQEDEELEQKVFAERDKFLKSKFDDCRIRNLFGSLLDDENFSMQNTCRSVEDDIACE